MLQVQTLNFPRTVSSQHEFVPLTTVYPESSKVEYRGTCTYRKNKCSNERTFNIRGKIHSLCQKHRDLHNRNQRNSQSKLKKTRRYELSLERLQHPRMLQNRRSVKMSMEFICRHPCPKRNVSHHVEEVDASEESDEGQAMIAMTLMGNQL